MNPPSATSHQSRTRQTREESRARIVSAATELVRSRSYSELSVGEIMERAGAGRTIFYRHFDDLADLLMKVGGAAIGELYEAQLELASARVEADRASIRQAIAAAVSVYHRHGPLLRAVAEAAAGDERVAAEYRALQERFDGLVAEAVVERPAFAGRTASEAAEVARALNRMNEGYLLDAFGREPRISLDTAADTLTDIWFGSLGPA